jgi:hypothetical protein
MQTLEMLPRVGLRMCATISDTASPPVILLFGAKCLPEVGRSLGQGITGFKELITTTKEVPEKPEDRHPEALEKERAKPQR